MSEIPRKVPKNGHSARAERSRERIIEHASNRFLRHGFTSIRIEDLAEELGMSKATVYRNFRSKEELLDICIQRFFEGIGYRARAIMDEPGTAKERAIRLGQLIGKELQIVDFSFLEDLRKNRPNRYRAWVENRLLFSAQLEEIVKQGQKEGDFRKDIPSCIPATMFWVSLNHMTDPDFLRKYPLSYTEVIETLMHVVFEGIIVHS